MLEETDVEYRDDEFNVGIVTYTIDGVQSTSLAERILFRRSLFRKSMSTKDERTG